MSIENTNNRVTLYIGTHNTTGLKYFGKTYCYFTREDLQKYYHGSGGYWNRHLKEHGDDVTMEIYGIYSLDEGTNDYVEPIALKFSRDNNIVKAINEDGDRKGKKVWANMKTENGLDGGQGKNLEKLRLNHIKREQEKAKDFFDKVDYNILKILKEEKYSKRKQLPKGRIKTSSELIKLSEAKKDKKQSKTHIENNRKAQLSRVTAFDIFKNETVTINELCFLENKHYIGIQAKKFFICDSILMRGKDLELYAKSKGFMGTNFSYKSDKFRLKFISSIKEINQEQYKENLIKGYLSKRYVFPCF